MTFSGDLSVLIFPHGREAIMVLDSEREREREREGGRDLSFRVLEDHVAGGGGRSR